MRRQHLAVYRPRALSVMHRADDALIARCARRTHLICDILLLMHALY
jgi:hypothetical protein